MSNDTIISEPNISWTESDTEGDDEEVDSRLVTLEDPSNIVSINVKGLCVQ